MIRFAGESRAKTFLIATEEGLIHRLKKENPEKAFYSAGPARICRNMKMTGLEDVVQSLLRNQFQIDVPEPVAAKARRALESMLAYA